MGHGYGMSSKDDSQIGEFWEMMEIEIFFS